MKKFKLTALVFVFGMMTQALVVSAQGSSTNNVNTKVLRYAFQVAESGFDPAQISDVNSRTVVANIFDAPLTYDFLARPAKLVPQTTVALPEVSDNFKRWVFRIRPGIYFSDDPAFKGQKRELVAADYVYAIKRHYDPAIKSPGLFLFENAKVLGLSALRKNALETKQPFDYDSEVAGLRTLDRYSFEIRLAEPAPRFGFILADAAVSGAVAREVIEAYPGKSMEHPVGTGPYKLTQWVRSSSMVLERNSNYREHYYDAQPANDDAQGQDILKKMKGKRLPMIDRVEIAIVEESQPRWLSFLNGELDMIERLPNEFSIVATPNNVLAPNLRKRGVQMEIAPAADTTFSYFAMEHPVVGGYTPDKVALRRAIALAYDNSREIALVRKGLAINAQAIIPPLVTGFEPYLKTEMSDYSVARARALLDLYGYTDKNGDGWRDLPDGQPLILEYASQPDQLSRQQQDLWYKAMKAINVKIEFKVAKLPEHIKSSRAGKLMMWGISWSAPSPDGSLFLDLMYGPNKGQANHSRFDLPAFNELYQRQLVMPDGPERDALIHDAKLLGVAYMPYKAHSHRLVTDLVHAQLQGYRRHPFARDFWRYVDIDKYKTQAR
jgi:ABC-type transport system substrate-binding protein